MIAKTHAIPIRVAAFGGTSQIVTWLTPEFGKISTSIKGAQRAKRVGGGQYDLGYLCELLFYERMHNGLHTFKDCTAIESRIKIRGLWQETAILSYFCLLAGSGSFPSVQSVPLYQKLLAAVRALENTQIHMQLLLWFELQMLALHGTAPQWKHCTICHCPPATPILIAPSAGGLICPHCNAKRGFTTYPVSAETLHLLQILQRLQNPPSNSGALRFPVDDAIVIVGECTALWMDIAPHARNIAVQMAKLELK